MKKRITASILASILFMSLLPYEVFADLQAPVREISKNPAIGHEIEMAKMIPKVEIGFLEPDASGQPDTTPGVTNGGNTHEEFLYQIWMDEYSSNKNVTYPDSPQKLENIPGYSLDDEEYQWIPIDGNRLDNGTLYETRIIPYHYHKTVDSDGKEGPDVWAKRTNEIPASEYVLTNFDTRIEGKAGSLEISWEDTGYHGMQYQIGYIQGNYEGKSLSEIEQESGNNRISRINLNADSPGVESYRDPQTGKSRFKYTISGENISMGQIYSAYVVSITDRIENKTILKNMTSPKIVTATTEIGLEVFNNGKDKIRLEWDGQIAQGTVGEYKLEKAEIMEYTGGSEDGRVIATLHGKEGVSLGYYEYREPKESTYYQLILTYRLGDKTLISKTSKVLYVPGELRTKPATPEIPKPIGPNTVVESGNKGEFLLPGDSLSDVPNIDLWKHDHTFHANMVTPPNLNFVWSAYKEDLSLLYDIWVTDDIGVTTSDAVPIIQDLSFNNGKNPQDVLYNRDRDEVIGFKHTLREYYNSDMQRLPLTPNKVYYIKIVAKKPYGSEYEPSLPATVTILFGPDGEVFAPPTISKPPLKIAPEGVGTTSITLSWLEIWHEIMARDFNKYPKDQQEKAKEWNAKVYTKTPTSTGPAILFKHEEGTREHILARKDDIGIIKNIVGHDYYAKNYIDRTVNLGKNVKYEYKYMPYEEILQGLAAYNATTNNKKDVEGYIEMLMKNEQDPDQDYGWKDINPKTVEDEHYTSWRQHTQDNLKPNTSYVFFVRPYSYDYDGAKLQASLPTWIVGTTLPDGEMEEGKPTVPVLSLHGKGDTHISVEWKYNKAFDYEIVYSRLEDPDKAIVWPFEISEDVTDSNYVEDGGTAVVEIDGLFPDTTYNVWIRAKQKKGNQLSAWSNPVTARTDLLGAPTAPAGLGIASYNSILEVGRDFKPVESNHITVEWERNGPDKDLDNTDQGGKNVEKQYYYLIEIADNPEFLDRKSALVGHDTVGGKEGNAEILSRTMVYFDELIANRPYYVRAKTRLIAYDNENNREIVMESDYTPFIRIITKPSQEEYDGEDKMNEVIYPEKIEESYDGETWIYEIMDTQKVIDEMVRGDEFRYLIPVQKYRGVHDAKYRVIRIPQPVISSLIRRRMELEIRTNILDIQIPAKALEASMMKTSADGMVEFVFETLSPDSMHGMSMGYEYGFLSRPEKMGITSKSSRGIAPITTVDALMKVRINMPYQHDYMYRNLGGYTYDTIGGQWKKGNHTFDKNKMQLVYTTGSIGTYAVYEKSRLPVYDGSLSPSMQNIVGKYDIVGLGSKYTPSSQVRTPEYINIMLGIAEKKSQIHPDASLTSSEISRASNSGIYTGNVNSVLTQEAAISGVIKLYELSHGIAIRPQTNRSVSNISSSYRTNIQKAYTIGLIDNIEPKQAINYKQLFDLIEQVIE